MTTQDNATHRDKLDPPRAVAIARRRWPLAAASLWQEAIAALRLSATQQTQYTALESPVLYDGGLDQVLLATPVVQLAVDPPREAEINVAVISSPFSPLNMAARPSSSAGKPVVPRGSTYCQSLADLRQDLAFKGLRSRCNQ